MENLVNIPQNLFHGKFKNKKIFITGHTGFIGSWLTLWLKLMGAHIVGYSLMPHTEPSLFNLLSLKNQITHIRGNILDLAKLTAAICEHDPEFVIHLAAQPLVRYSYIDPILTFQTNIIGTANILDALRKTSSVKSCVIMTSDKCYENMEWEYAYRENDRMGGHDPYSASKGASELVFSSYRRSFFCDQNIGLATVRAGNVIGGGDWSTDRLIPDTIRAIASKKPVLIRNPNSVRPWQFVLDPIAGILLLALNLYNHPHKFSEGWNFGPSVSSGVPVKIIVKKIIDTLGYGKWQDVSKSTQPHEAKYLRLDSTKASHFLGWRQVYSLDESINETISWYSNYLSKNTISDFTMSQISKYCQKAQEMNIIWATT